MKHEDLIARPGHSLHLADVDTKCTHGFEEKADAQEKLERDIARLAQLQDVFYAARSHALLLVLQGMDSAGKDGAIKHVMSGVNPQGVDVHSFKAPTEEETEHDFLWRCQNVLPARGRIGIFNRSYYEDVLVVRVHEDMLAREGVPEHKGVWSQRFEDINAFERHLARNGTIVVKVFLHLSKDEQRKRLLERLDDPAKNWKFSANDIKERQYWDRYLRMYEKMISHTNSAWAPWYVIPADRKWFVRTAIADILVAHLEALKLQYPKPDEQTGAVLAEMRERLEAE